MALSLISSDIQAAWAGPASGGGWPLTAGTEAQLSWSPTSGLTRGRHPVLCSTSCSQDQTQWQIIPVITIKGHHQYFPLGAMARGVSVPCLPPQCNVLDGPQLNSSQFGAGRCSLASHYLGREEPRSDLKQNKHLNEIKCF